jgi:O-6-methylguanine DNA methyltransferase
VSDVTGNIEPESAGSLHRKLLEVLGTAPSAEQTGIGAMIDVLDAPVGPLIAAANEHALVLLEFADRDRFAEQLSRVRAQLGTALVPGTDRWLDALRIQLEEYFAGKRRLFDLPLAYRGTEFQEKVWSTLLTIPYGETWSYRQVADRIGDPQATRAVGMANGSNRIAIVIPCHRVVNANGTLGGYGGGPWRKRILLDLESRQRGFEL